MGKIVYGNFQDKKKESSTADRKPKSNLEKIANYIGIQKDAAYHLTALLQGATAGATFGALSQALVFLGHAGIEKFGNDPNYFAFSAITGGSIGMLVGVITADNKYQNRNLVASDNVSTYRVHYKKIFSK